MDEEKDYKEIVRFHLFPTDYRLLFRIIAAFVSWYFNQSVFLGYNPFLFRLDLYGLRYGYGWFFRRWFRIYFGILPKNKLKPFLFSKVKQQTGTT